MINPTDTAAINRAVAELRSDIHQVDLLSVGDVQLFVHGTGAVYSPATNIAQAWELVEEMTEGNNTVDIATGQEKGKVHFWNDKTASWTIHTKAKKVPAAICLAWLQWKKEAKEKPTAG